VILYRRYFWRVAIGDTVRLEDLYRWYFFGCIAYIANDYRDTFKQYRQQPWLLNIVPPSYVIIYMLTFVHVTDSNSIESSHCGLKTNCIISEYVSRLVNRRRAYKSIDSYGESRYSYQIYYDMSITGIICQTADAKIGASQKTCCGGLRSSCVAVAAEWLRNAGN
jgi:hypothetical protein